MTLLLARNVSFIDPFFSCKAFVTYFTWKIPLLEIYIYWCSQYIYLVLKWFACNAGFDLSVIPGRGVKIVPNAIFLRSHSCPTSSGSLSKKSGSSSAAPRNSSAIWALPAVSYQHGWINRGEPIHLSEHSGRLQLATSTSADLNIHLRDPHTLTHHQAQGS